MNEVVSCVVGEYGELFIGYFGLIMEVSKCSQVLISRVYLEEIRARLDYFKRCLEVRFIRVYRAGVQALLSALGPGCEPRGLCAEHVGSLLQRPLRGLFGRLPYSYKPSKEPPVLFFPPIFWVRSFGSLLGEVDETSFGQVRAK